MIMTAVKNSSYHIEPEGREEDFSGTSVGRRDQPYASFYHPRSAAASAAGRDQKSHSLGKRN